MNVHFSKASDDWTTPDDLYNRLNEEFSFQCDVAATDENTKHHRAWINSEMDALNTDWEKRNWCNPPYSKLKAFVKKASEEAKNGNLTVMLIPARTDTIAFHEYIYNKPNVEVRFLKGRLKFGNSKNSAPFPSMIVIFRPTLEKK